MTKNILTQERLKYILNYCCDSGVFTRAAKVPGFRIDSIAGTIDTGHSGKRYIRICVDGKVYRAHRLAFLYMTGELPKKQVDHIDGNGQNNTWANLRLATQSDNSRNMRKRCSNTSGVQGVSWSSSCNKWRAYIATKNTNHYHLGTYDSFIDAVIVRKMAEYRLGYHENHGSEREL